MTSECHYIIDTNIFIEASNFLLSLYSKAPCKIWTISETMNIECKDQSSLRQLEALRTICEIRSPDKFYVDKVSRFAKRTGDIASLSPVDIKLMALTLMFEKQIHGNLDHIRKEPFPTKTITGSYKNHTNQITEIEDQNVDQDGWITEESLSLSRKSFTTKSFDSNSSVFCITCDFAMQNVLMQMGLKVLTPSGRSISQLKTFVLRCHACHYIVDTSKKSSLVQFCSNCGNSTLIKTTTSINISTGERILHLKSNFQYNLRGTIYSIPKPKGCRSYNSNELILREDQKEYTRAINGYERSLKKEFDFSDDLSIRHSLSKPPIIGYGKRNPNQSRKIK